jgi:hypothetical protein
MSRHWQLQAPALPLSGTKKCITMTWSTGSTLEIEILAFQFPENVITREGRDLVITLSDNGLQLVLKYDGRCNFVRIFHFVGRPT